MSTKIKHVLASDGQLVWTDAELPNPGPDEVLIEIHFAGLNRADLLQAKGLYPPPPGASEALGLECSGIVIEAGDDVADDLPVDTRVMALLAGGGYATHALVPAEQVVMLTKHLGLVEGAGLLETFVTAHSNHLYLLEPSKKKRFSSTVVLVASEQRLSTSAVHSGCEPLSPSVTGPAERDASSSEPKASQSTMTTYRLPTSSAQPETDGNLDPTSFSIASEGPTLASTSTLSHRGTLSYHRTTRWTACAT